VGERDLERPRNNLKTVLKSLQLLLQRKCIDFEIYLIGKHSEALKRHIESLRIKGLNIYLFDYLSRPNLLSLLDKVDVCIVPRYIKDQGGYLPLEAMARGATIIASDMPAFRDFITNGVTGLLVDPWNYIDMANSIQLLIENRDYLKKLQTNSLKYINEFHSLDTVGKLYLLFYSNFIF
jgi:Glycosyltransferase